MAKTGRPKAELVLSDDERGQLERWARRAKSSQALALRCRIVLACADGLDNKQVADKLGCHQVTVGKSRFVAARLAGLHDEDRVGRLPGVGMGMQSSNAACGHSSQCTTAQTAPGAGVLIV